MLLTLITLTLAAPQVAVSAGPAFARGTDWGTYPSAGYSTYGPMVSGTVNWNFGPLHTFAGSSVTGLLASSRLDPYPASLISADFGIGLGSQMFGIGLYGGWGFPRSLSGVYTQVTLPTDAGRMGGELRVFSTGNIDLAGMAVMFRWEPDMQPYRDPPRPPPPPPPPEPPPLYNDPPYGA